MIDPLTLILMLIVVCYLQFETHEQQEMLKNALLPCYSS